MNLDGAFIDVEKYFKSKGPYWNGSYTVYKFSMDNIREGSEYAVLVKPDRNVHLIVNKVYKILKNKKNYPNITIINEKGIKAQYPKSYFISLPFNCSEYLDFERMRLEKLKKLDLENE